MATVDEWSKSFGRQAAADFKTFKLLQAQSVPECHRLQFLQMACEKLVKAHLCGSGTSLASLQTSHAYISGCLPVVLRQEAVALNFKNSRSVLDRVKHFAGEVELLAPAVKKEGKRPDNCEYPWEDDNGSLHDPLSWSFYPSQMLVEPGGRSILKLIKSAIDRAC